tara:strand:+ start:920 stop:1627 length:708 start_codon:yes stop_codon:yes gene_type:complete
MAGANNLVSIKLIADRLMRNPLMKDLSYEFIVDNAIQLMRILDAPSLYVTRREALNVENYRALKPIDMIKVEGIARTNGGNLTPLQSTEYIAQEFIGQGEKSPSRPEDTYSFNSKYINLNFESGEVQVIYKAVATDDECYPLVLDNETLLRCIESYIKWKWFDIMNDMEMISDRKLSKAEQDYTFNVAQADANMKLPSTDEMEMITNQIVQLIPSRTAFSRRFEYLGSQENLRIN